MQRVTRKTVRERREGHLSANGIPKISLRRQLVLPGRVNSEWFVNGVLKPDPECLASWISTTRP